MKLKAILVTLFLILSMGSYAQAIKDTKFGRNDPTNLTDQDKDLSENFVHEQRTQRIYEEECTKDGKTEDACLGRKADEKFLGMKGSMVSMLAKAYTMVIGMSDVGGGIETEESIAAKKNNAEIEKADGAEGAGKEQDAESKEKKDYCKYIPVATEAISMFNTTEDQKTIGLLPSSEDSAQRESLMKAAENHESRAKTAKIQTTGWGVGTACYAGMMVAGSGYASWSNWLKFGASALMTSFYQGQIGAHEEYADKTRSIAEKLPKKGDCNPITDKTCFCTEETSKNRSDYAQYCRPTLHKRNIAYKSERLACIDENMKEDTACACAQRDTCIDKKVMTTIKGFGGTNIGSMPMFPEFSQLSQGELTSKALTNTNNTLNNALAKLRQYDKKLPETNTILNKKQKEEMQILTDMGLPPRFSKKMVLTPTSPRDIKKNLSKFNGAGSGRARTRYSSSNNKKKRSNVLTFSGGSGINKEQRKKKSKKNDFFKRFGLKKKKRKKSNGKVLKFANKARGEAQISKNKNRHIFDIISRRYQVSGWKRLEYIKD